MNEPEPAIKWLNYTAENGYPNLTWFERDPNLDKLRKDPRFIEFLEKVRPRFERLKALSQTDITPVSNSVQSGLAVYRVVIFSSSSVRARRGFSQREDHCAENPSTD